MDSGPSGDGRGLLCLKYLNKAIIRYPRKDEGFISSKVYCRSCMLYACTKLSQGSRDLVLIFVNKIFVIGKSLTKITKTFLLEIIQLGYTVNGKESPIPWSSEAY